jgi:hypothetical protein
MDLGTGHLSTDLQRVYLRLLRDLYEVSASLGTCTYVWGGMVVDILHGAFLRAHHDIDGFTRDLLRVKDDMASMLVEKGYTTSYLDEVDMLQIRRGDVRAALNRLEVDGSTAMWRHVGDQGTIYFPVDWLDPTPRRFCGVNVYISGARFEYAIKVGVHLLNPEWQLRDKDRAAIRLLKAELDRNGYDRTEIMEKIWSYTPYWVHRGRI